MGGSYVNEAFVKRSLVFSIFTMILMAGMISIFAQEETTDPTRSAYATELDELTANYGSMTGTSATNEEIWGLTGIYTPYGVNRDGQPSTAHLVLDDGWVAGDRIVEYTPAQFNNLDGDKEKYTVVYDSAKGLYYYKSHGSNIEGITDNTYDESGSLTNYGSLYTRVAMGVDHKSDIFFTIGSKQQLDNGTFYYKFSGYRYCFQPLADYYYDKSTPVTHTNTSLSLVWYQYTGDQGIAGQLILSGGDQGVSYLTATQIVQAFNSASFTSKFTMKFNNMDMNVYIHLNEYAISHGYSVEQCFNLGYWDVMVTSQSTSVTNGGTTGLTTDFSPTKLLDTLVSLLTFNLDKYGFEGNAATLASAVFSVSMYTSLIAIGLSCWPLLIIPAILAVLQALATFHWPW